MARGARKLERKAMHDVRAREEPMLGDVDQPTLIRVAHGICEAVYAGPCACRKRLDLPTCSTMLLAGWGAIKRVTGEIAG